MKSKQSEKNKQRLQSKRAAAIAGLILIIIALIFYFLPGSRPVKNTSEQVVAEAKTQTFSTVPTSEARGPNKSEIQNRSQAKIKPPPGAIAEEIVIAEVEAANYFLGRWCNNELWKDSGGFFSLEFGLTEGGEIKATFTNGGPFSQALSVKVLGQEADLYFESVDGSMAFNEAAIKYDAKDCTERVASARIIDRNSMEVANFNDVCGYLAAPAEALLLARLKDGEICTAHGDQDVEFSQP